MPKLLVLSSVLAMNGRVATGSFGNNFVFEAPDDITAKQKYDAIKGFAAIYKKLFVASVTVHRLRISAVPTPGLKSVDRTKHVTVYFGDKGAQALPAGKQVGPLNICAHYVKYATEGTAGDILIRGTINESEVDTDDEGFLVMPTGDDLARYQAFETECHAFFKNLGGRGLVMLGPKTLDNGTFPSQVQYVQSARPVEKVEFDALTFRNLNKTIVSIDGQRRALLRAEVKNLQGRYNEFKQNSEGGVLVQGDTDTLMDMGKLIYAHYSANERNKVRIPTVLKTYIKA
jgi:hypothetical protein